MAGADHPLFTREAAALIHEHAGGIPRTISVICDNALLNAFATGRQLVDGALVREVCRDFDLPSGSAARTVAAHESAVAQTTAGQVSMLHIRKAAECGASEGEPRRRTAAFF
jgi:hypothetical protein